MDARVKQDKEYSKRIYRATGDIWLLRDGQGVPEDAAYAMVMAGFNLDIGEMALAMSLLGREGSA